MAKPITINPIMFRYSGVFDFRGLYDAAKAWYTSVYATVNWESLYKDKVSGPGVREVEIKMEGYVKWDRYRRWNIKIEFKTWDQKDIVVEGKQMSQGRIQIIISSTIDMDYAGMYGGNKSKFIQTLGKILYNVLKKDKDFAVKKKCEKEMFRLQTEFKRIIGMPA